MLSATRNPPIPDAPVAGPHAWIGAEMATTPNQWRVTLSPDQLGDLEAAASHFVALGKDVLEITERDFPLRQFDKYLSGLRGRLLRGAGFEVLRGLPTDKYTEEYASVIFCGIGAHLGNARSQNKRGDMLGHVRNTGASSDDPNTRIYQTAERQTFHTDSADVVGLLCLQEAREGGLSLLVSASTIYNRMRALRPDLAALLFDPIATDRRGEVPEGARPYMEIPPLSWHEGFLTVFYQRQYIDSAQRFESAMALTPAHIEALDMFDALANDPELNLSMRLRPGDMQFVYNHAQLHDRTSFTDCPNPAKRRHLLRLWLSIPGDRPLPECFKERYGSIEVGNRGGIYTS
ncbi:MAG: TauD/TfdA family dioxygenase [Woeseiaceae bacterium]